MNDINSISSKISDLATALESRNVQMRHALEQIDALTSCPGNRTPADALKDIHQIIAGMHFAS